MSCIALHINAQQVEIKMADGVNLSVTPLADNAVRICHGESSTLPELTYVDGGQKVTRKVSTQGDYTIITLKKMTVEVDKQSGQIRYLDARGGVVLTEQAYSLTPSKVQGDDTFIATATFDSPSTESLYGLGQFQDGYLNVRGLPRRLTQVNTQISIPFYLSNRGYAVLWNNYGMTDFNPCQQSVRMERKSDGKVTEVDATGTSGNRRERRQESVFQATVDIPEDGDYALLLDVGQAMARRHNLSVEGVEGETLKNPVIEAANVWLPPTVSKIVRLKKGTHTFTSDLTSNDKPTLYYGKVENQTVLRSPVAENVNYTVFVGDADETIGAYRQLTGQTPLPPAWAFGYIHCRERFHSSDEILSTANTFRQKQLPMDVMVQDWQWWGKYGWNAMKFDEQYYPDPKLLVDSLHNLGSRLMLSVWSKIDKNSEVGKQAQAKGYYIPGTDWIDFFNPEASDYYWENFSNSLLKPYGIDCWWQDAVEPENDDLLNRRINNGKWPGELFRNTYPLLVSKVVYEGNMKDRPDQRTSILTRCAAPGIQRYGSFLWSGDVGNDWQTLRYQVAAGLSVNASGHPWWTYDAGGFFRPGGGQYNDPAFHKRFLRWLQISTFLPMMRVHGYQTDTEFWRYGEDVVREARQQLELRYRLFPYIYSTAYQVTKGSTMMRPLVMDYPNDRVALSIQNQYMFGKNIMVGTPSEENDTEFRMYFPKVTGGWYDLHTGKRFKDLIPANERSQSSRPEGQYGTLTISGSFIPVFVKAGTILPMAKPMQTTAEYDPSELDICVYPGADGEFLLYEDDGVSTQNEKGKFCTIQLSWNNTKRELTIGKANGSYQGMPLQRTLNIQTPDKKVTTVQYKGKALTVKL